MSSALTKVMRLETLFNYTLQWPRPSSHGYVPPKLQITSNQRNARKNNNIFKEEIVSKENCEPS